MRGRGDPAWRRYYDVCGRAMILLCEGRLSRSCYTIVHEQARRRALREQASDAAGTTPAAAASVGLSGVRRLRGRDPAFRIGLEADDGFND